jgi:hypothetical protein
MDEINATALPGIGAAFDFHAGTIPRAVRWMLQSGLERRPVPDILAIGNRGRLVPDLPGFSGFCSGWLAYSSSKLPLAGTLRISGFRLEPAFLSY